MGKARDTLRALRGARVRYARDGEPIQEVASTRWTRQTTDTSWEPPGANGCQHKWKSVGLRGAKRTICRKCEEPAPK